QSHACDEQPDRLGLLARRHERGLWLPDGVDKRPGFDHKCTDKQRIEEVVDGPIASETKHGVTLPCPRRRRGLMNRPPLLIVLALPRRPRRSRQVVVLAKFFIVADLIVVS